MAILKKKKKSNTTTILTHWLYQVTYPCHADSEYFTFLNGKDPDEAKYAYLESYVMGLWILNQSERVWVVNSK